MQPGRFIVEINIVYNYISDNFYFDNEVVQSNLNFWYLVVPQIPKLRLIWQFVIDSFFDCMKFSSTYWRYWEQSFITGDILVKYGTSHAFTCFGNVGEHNTGIYVQLINVFLEHSSKLNISIFIFFNLKEAFAFCHVPHPFRGFILGWHILNLDCTPAISYYFYIWMFGPSGSCLNQSHLLYWRFH